MRRYMKKKSNSNPLKSLFEVEYFLKNMTKIKNIISLSKKCTKLTK